MKWLVIFLFFCSCAHLPCPKQDLYFVISMEDGIPHPLFMEKGFLDNREAWKTPEEFEEFIREYNRYKQQLREREYDRQFGTD